MFWILCIFFWVFPRRQIKFCRRFRTLCQVHLQRLDEEYVFWENPKENTQPSLCTDYSDTCVDRQQTQNVVQSFSARIVLIYGADRV
jgi:hypothetical protein